MDTFVIIGFHKNYGGTWAIGNTEAEVLANAKREGLAVAKGYSLLHWDTPIEDLKIDGMGRVSWVGEDPIQTDVPARKRR